ncbi:uncharacterized protein si:ch211-67e16.4 isoform X2 [Hoplias malabaricus]|uniref:uncharacterized protein si:ch211-67e16.4 isoform X2 n=1 Tax=Hoplias malabaricus TaxID=27720 RepID=UPI003461803D
MDVNLTISLMRGQMGVVIEKAVNAAVETVLGEMIRVVSLKLEEFRREMTAKEKENQNIRNMLEMSRCQMKTMRRYVSALTAREERHNLQSHRPDRAVMLQMGTGRFRGVQPQRETLPSRRSSAVSSSGSVQLQSNVTPSKPAHATETVWDTQLTADKTQRGVQEPVLAESYTSPDTYSEEIHAPKLHLGPLKETSSAIVIESEGLVAESSDPLWGQTPLAPPAPLSSSEVEHTDTIDSNLLPVPDSSVVYNPAAVSSEAAPFKVKQEEGEVEIVQVKEEPVDTASSECPVVEAGPGMSLELPLTQQCPQIACPSVNEQGFIGVDPSTYAESQLAMAGNQRQVRPWCKDLSLYEEYKRKRIEVRKRSETRRRELEQTLPQALLADLVKERREKTRLRVARWRAKRKLQACLMSQAAQLNGAPVPGLITQRGSLRRGGGAAHRGGFPLSRAGSSETGGYNLPLQIGSRPLLAAQRLGVAEGQMQPGPSMYPHHRTPTSGSEMFQ